MFGQSPFGTTPLGGYTAPAAGGVTNYADNLSVGAYLFSGKTLSDSVGKADALSVGAYTYTGQDITDVKTGGSTSYADTLNAGAYALTGNTVTDVKTGATSYLDSLETGIYTITGLSLDDNYNHLQPVSFQTKGGFSPTVKARKFKKSDRDEIVEAVKIAVNGEPIAEAQIVEVVAEVTKELKPRDFVSEIAQYEYAIEKTRAILQKIIDAETDDEETILLLM